MFGYKTAKVTATGNVTTGPARLIAIHAVCAGSAGSIVLKDASTGETRFDKREAYKNRLLTTAAELVMREYDPAKQNLDKFLSTRLSLRANKIATDMGVSSTFTKDIADIKESEVDAIM